MPFVAQEAGTYWQERYNSICAVKDTFKIVSECEEPEIFIPNLITPNKDGDNDVFVAKNKKIPDWNIEIYNRWGDLVLNQKDIGMTGEISM